MSAQPALREVLAGTLGERYGALAVVPLPQDDELLIGFVKALAEVLKDKGLYRRDKVIMIPYDEKRRLEVMEAKAFCSWTQRFVVGSKTKYDAGKPYTVKKDVPTEVAEKTLMSWDFFPEIPEIHEIHPAPMPLLRDDKLVLMEEGYDKDSGTLTFGLGKNEKKSDGAAPYDDSWTMADGVAYLRGILSEFPFGDLVEVPIADQDGGGVRIECRSMAVQVAAMISQFAAAMVPWPTARMGFIFNANSQRSGKTLLAKMALIPLHGSFEAQSWKSKEEDLQKVVDAEMLMAASYICFDNVKSYVGSPALEGLMTAPEWKGRVLGKTEMFVAKNRMTLFITGNDLNVSPDMNHRSLLCDLFVPQGDVQERSVKKVIDDKWLMDLKNRRDILSALWAIVRDWHTAGMPLASKNFGYKTRLGFENWGDIIGGMVAHAGFGNCLEPVKLENAGDSEDRNIRALVAQLAERIFDDEPVKFTFQQLINICHENDIFARDLDGSLKDGDFKLKPKANSSFAKKLLRYAPAKQPRIYRLDKDTSVYFSNEGEARERRYIVEIKRSVSA